MKRDNYYLDLEERGYYDTIDKRSKDYREYKEWKASKMDVKYEELKNNIEKDQSVGLGDVVESITKATRVKNIVEAITDDCGCDERKEKFNKIKLWKKRNVNCIEKEDYNYLKDLIAKNTTKFTFEVREEVVRIYNHVFRTKVKNTKCSPCMNSYIRKLKQYLEIYES